MDLQRYFNPNTAIIDGATVTERRLEDMRGMFANETEYQRTLDAEGNVLIYSVQMVEMGDADGDLHYGTGMIMPGHIGNEYFMTKGHLHRWREAAEIYVGLRGNGMMLLEDEASGESKLLPLAPKSIVYVPGHTAHRTINTGREPLTYLGIFSARAGHDYGAIAERNFRNVVVDVTGRATMLPREEFLETIR